MYQQTGLQTPRALLNRSWYFVSYPALAGAVVAEAERAADCTAAGTAAVTDTVKAVLVAVVAAVVVATVTCCHNGNIPAGHRLRCYRNMDIDTIVALQSLNFQQKIQVHYILGLV